VHAGDKHHKSTSGELATNVLSTAVDVIPARSRTFWAAAFSARQKRRACETFQLGVAVHLSGDGRWVTMLYSAWCRRIPSFCRRRVNIITLTDVIGRR